MKKKADSTGSDSLRKRAEKVVFDRSEGHRTITAMPPEEIKKLVHDLSVYQLELEMQNDELRRLQNELQHSRNKYTHLYDFSPVGYLTLNEKGIIEEVNLTGASMLGVERRHLIGQSFSRFVYKQDQDIFYTLRQHLLETEMPQSSELRLVNKDGREFYAHLECMLVADASGRQIRTVVNDITDKKNAEAAVRQSEERYRAMLETMPDGVYICSEDFRIEYMNPKMIRRIGHNATGKVCYKSIYNTEEICTLCGWDRIRQGGHVEYEIVNPADNRHYSISSTPILQPGGKISKFTISRDITHRKRMETRIRQAHKMEAIAKLAGGIAHDFNNILYMIIGNSELALGKIPEKSPAESHLDKIKTAALRAADIVKHLLDFSRKIDQDLQPVNAATAVKDSIGFLRSMIPSTIDIRININDPKVLMMADPTQIRQALMNICINSFQAMRETGGVLEISVDKEALTEGFVDTYYHLKAGDYVKITVSDTGPGIDPECIDSIFDPYFTTRKIGEGSGLGLAVVHGIVKNHNGGVIVESRPGSGASFILLFPAIPEQPVIGAKAQEEFPPGTETILFIDDEEFIADMTKEMLEMLGYRVQTRLNPKDALTLFRSKPHKFDLVITDMTMPEMNGIKLLEALKAVRSDIPVIISTGHNPLIDEETAAQKGFAAYIMKPFTMSEIAKTIRKVLGNK